MFDFHFKINYVCMYVCICISVSVYYLPIYRCLSEGMCIFPWNDSDFPVSCGEFALIWFSLFQKYNIIYVYNILKQFIPISNGIKKNLSVQKWNWMPGKLLSFLLLNLVQCTSFQGHCEK